jgi:NarL family two-component system response regulator LiaR
VNIRDLVLSRPIPDKLIAALRDAPLVKNPRLSHARKLTPALQAVLPLIADGKTDQEIADQLGITLPATKDRVLRLLALYDVDNRTELAMLVHTNRLEVPN